MPPLIDPAGRPHLQCEECRTAVVLPSAASAGQRAEFAAIVRSDSVQGIRLAESAFSLSPREANALVLHVTLEPGKCQRCGRDVDAGESVCLCRSVNLNW